MEDPRLLPLLSSIVTMIMMRTGILSSIVQTPQVNTGDGPCKAFRDKILRIDTIGTIIHDEETLQMGITDILQKSMEEDLHQKDISETPLKDMTEILQKRGRHLIKKGQLTRETLESQTPRTATDETPRTLTRP